MSRRKDTFTEALEKARVKPLDYTPSVGRQRHLTLTLPNSHYSGYGGGRVDTTVTLTADEADELATKLRDAAHDLRAAS